MDKVIQAARSSGSLNLSNRDLEEVPKQVYNILENVGTGEKWWEAVDLEKLILAHNSITVITDELEKLSCLTVLNVSHNQLTSLPAAIGRLTNLKLLDVSFNSLREIPEEVGSATSLVVLNCANNQLTVLPCSIGKCLELAELKASNNNLIKLPSGMTHCAKLRNLNVEGNKLSELPDDLLNICTMLTELNCAKNILSEIPGSIGKLTCLIRLDLHQNRISVLPPEISGCSSLTELYLGNNQIFSVPAEISALSCIGTLDLHSNKIKEFPAEACKLRLSALDLSNNNLIGLPPQLGMMTTLRKLLLAGNPLRTLRSSLVLGPTQALLKYLRSRMPTDEDNLPMTSTLGSPFGVGVRDPILMASREALSSKELIINGMRLEMLPAAAWESGNLITLDISKNEIKELPMELSMCISFEVLLLSDNKIKEWPGAVFASLSRLKCLKFDKNPLCQIPQGAFAVFAKLQILDLSGIAGPLPDPPSLLDMPELQELYLRRLRLTEVPHDITILCHLRILDLSQNSLSFLPESIWQLTCLEELDVSDNNIATLPSELGLMDSCLKSLKLTGNPIRSIRRTILDRGTNAVLQYLKDRLPS